jgi:rhodanese-related sulfurtransferase
MRRLFALDAKIVVGCATGTRFARAAEILVAAGFRDVADQRAGMEGARDPFRRLKEPGWAAAGLPMAKGADARSYDRIKTRVDA